MSELVVAVLAMGAAVLACWPVWRQTVADAFHPLDPHAVVHPRPHPDQGLDARVDERPPGRHAVVHHWRPADLIPHTPRYLPGAAT